MTGAGIAVPSDRIREHAERLAAGPVGRHTLALEFPESAASSAELRLPTNPETRGASAAPS